LIDSDQRIYPYVTDDDDDMMYLVAQIRGMEKGDTMMVMAGYEPKCTCTTGAGGLTDPACPRHGYGR